MSYLVLARKYRPSAFQQVVGQQGVVRTLKNAIDMDRVAHAYLFTGARGVGKTTVARLLARALNCESGPTAEPDDGCSMCQEIARGASPDVFEIDGASNTGVDDVRQLRDNSQYMPARARFKIYIIDEVHMLSTSAFNALLKTLEEPPPHVKFIFATTEPHKIPLTVLSRCQRFDFKRIPAEPIREHLRHVLASEGMQIDEDGLRIIARQAGGSMRDALSLTDQVLAFGGDEIGVEQVRQALGLAGTAVYEQIVGAIIDKQPDVLMRLVEDLFDKGHDLRRFIEGLMWHVHHLILFSSLSDPGDLIELLPEERERMGEQASRVDGLRWHQIFDVLSRTASEVARNPYPRLVLETALLRLASIESVVGVDDLLARVEQLARQISGGGPVRATGGSGSGTPRASGGGFKPPASVTGSEPRASSSPEASPGPSSPPSVPARQDPSPASETTPSEPTPKQAAPPPGAELEGEEAFERLVDYVNEHRPSLGSFLTHARPRRVLAGEVILAMEPGSFFADQIRAPRNLKALEHFCSEFFGRPTRVQVEELGEGDGPSLADSREQAARKADADLRQEALDHPMVKEAIRVFGAQVDHVKTNSGTEG